MLFRSNGPEKKAESQEEIRQIIREFGKDVVAATEEFEKHYPTDARRWESQLFRLELTLLQAQVEETTPDYAAALKQLESIIAAPDVSSYAKRQARAMSRELQSQQAAAAKMKDLQSKPLDLKFTAVDGKEVDLAKLRGKVVLVDFWATWCGPCVREVPNVVATYQKYREKGFEIVGISLDKDKDRMRAFTEKSQMTWPQYFDGQVWENAISTRFEIHSIPTMWLVDKKGFVRNTGARGGELGAAVEKLLAE